MSDTALLLRDVGYAHPGKPATLRHVTLHVPKGRITVVMGPNGSGKTTLLRIAAGLTRPQEGEAIASGLPAHLAMRRGRIGYIPQHLGLVRSASVLDNVLLGGLRESGLLSLVGLYPSATRERAEEALQQVGLHEKAAQPAKNLSGGERQRVAIARTLVQRPDVIVADELIASLDAGRAHAIMEIAQGLRKRGVALLMALHQIDVALANADQVLFLVRGGLSNPRRPHEMTPEEARFALTA